MYAYDYPGGVCVGKVVVKMKWNKVSARYIIISPYRKTEPRTSQAITRT